MKLIDELRLAAQQPGSIFAAQLLKEDIARLEKLERLAVERPVLEEFRKAAFTLGWTPGDLRTFELNPELGAFIESVHCLLSMQPSANRDLIVETTWQAFHRRRIDLLVGCLSRPRLEI